MAENKRNDLLEGEKPSEEGTGGACAGFSGRFEWTHVTRQEDAPEYDTESEEVARAGGKGIPLSRLSIAFAVAAVILTVVLLVSDSLINRSYRLVEAANVRYLSAREAVADLEEGSDWLTDRARCYAVSGERQYMDDYFEEVRVTKRRDNALVSLRDLLEGDGGRAYDSLAAALGYSNELMEREYLSIRLAAASVGEPESGLPEEVAGVVLDPEYASLDRDGMREAARGLVFDDSYMAYKNLIRENVSRCTDNLIADAEMSVDNAFLHLNRLLGIQTVLTVTMLAMMLVGVVFINTQVRKPLTEIVRLMREERPAPVRGVEELRFVTETYNQVLEENRQVRRHLTYEASHDALTGLYNRSAYEMFTQSVDQNHIALLLIDVDKFKNFNDTYGHDVGDRVLVRVAEVLKSCFRSGDVICRIGGDEFVVIMLRVNSSMTDMVCEKVAKMREELTSGHGGLPKITLSVGVAFSDRKNPAGDIFKDADTALYSVKNNGRDGCAVYE